MNFLNKKIGFALTGSFCTFDTVTKELETLIAEGADVFPIFSFNAKEIDSRFGPAKDFLARVEEQCGRKAIVTIEDAEPIGPEGYLDALVIIPCTGNTLAKLSNGITDSPVLMAAKAHLRNEKPLLLSISTNDALSMNLKNIGSLMNTKHVFFIPFGQDNPVKKPNSMIAHTDRLLPALEAALGHKQLQPVIISPF